MVSFQSVISLSSVFNRSTCITHVLRMCYSRLELLLHYACITLVLRLRYACVTLALRLCYACVTLVLRLRYAWVTLGLRLGYINIKLSRQLSVCHQSDVSLSSLCRLLSVGDSRRRQRRRWQQAAAHLRGQKTRENCEKVFHALNDPVHVGPELGLICVCWLALKGKENTIQCSFLSFF